MEFRHALAGGEPVLVTYTAVLDARPPPACERTQAGQSPSRHAAPAPTHPTRLSLFLFFLLSRPHHSLMHHSFGLDAPGASRVERSFTLPENQVLAHEALVYATKRALLIVTRRHTSTTRLDGARDGLPSRSAAPHQIP